MEILEELWYGNIRPSEKAGYGVEEYRELLGYCDHNQKKLLETLSPKQQEDFQKIHDIWVDMERICECGAFIKGFQLAVQLMVAAM